MQRKGAVMMVVLLAAALAATAVSAQEKYPTRQVECIINFPPGGPVDTSIRIIAPALQAALGVPLVLTTKGGAAGALGADFVVKAKPDGYIVLSSANAAMTVAPIMNPQIAYRYQDFIPIACFTADPGVITSKTGAPWKTLEELVEYAKKNPGKLNYGSPGMGTVAYFAMEIFKLSYGLDIVPVHFQGTGPVKNAIMGGHVDLAASGFGSLSPLIKAGNIFPLVSTATKRVAAFPDVPTMAEKGFPDASLNIWNGLFVSKKSPKAVVDRLSAAMEKVMKDPQIVSQVEKAGLFVDYRNTEATNKLLDQEYAAVEKVVKKIGLGK